MSKYMLKLKCSCGHEEELTVRNSDGEAISSDNGLQLYINGDDPSHNTITFECSECKARISLVLEKDDDITDAVIVSEEIIPTDENIKEEDNVLEEISNER